MGLEGDNRRLNCCKKYNTLYEMRLFSVEFLVENFPY